MQGQEKLVGDKTPRHGEATRLFLAAIITIILKLILKFVSDPCYEAE